MRKYGIPTIIATGLLTLLGGILFLPGGQQGSVEVAEGKKGATTNSNGVIRGLVVRGGFITQISAGLVQPQDIATTTTSGTFGDGGNVPSFTVNSAGQITNATSIPVALPPSGITAGTLSDGSHVPVYTVTNTGILTNFVNTPQVIRDQGGQVFNVKADKYGAKGDGTTDDTTAIQSAFNDALTVGGEVFFPPPTPSYLTTSTINIGGLNSAPQSTVSARAPPIQKGHTSGLITYNGPSNSSVFVLLGITDWRFENIGVTLASGISNVVVWDQQYSSTYPNSGLAKLIKCNTIFTNNLNCQWVRLGQGGGNSNGYNIKFHDCVVEDNTPSSGSIALQIGGSQNYSPTLYDPTFNCSCNILCGPIASYLTANVTGGVTTAIPVGDTLLFPSSGTLSIGGVTASYTSKSTPTGPGNLNLPAAFPNSFGGGSQVSFSVPNQGVYNGNCSVKVIGGSLQGNSMGYDVLVECPGYLGLESMQCQNAISVPRRFLQIGQGAASSPVHVTMKNVTLKNYQAPTIDTNGVIWPHWNTTLEMDGCSANSLSGTAYSSTNNNWLINNFNAANFGTIRMRNCDFFATFPFINETRGWPVKYDLVQLVSSSGSVLSSYDNNPTNYRSVTTSTVTVSTTDYLVACNAASNAQTVNLPAAATVPIGWTYIIKKTDSSGNAVTVTPAGSDKIDGAATYALSAQYKYLKIESDGVANWQVVGSN